MATQRPSVDVVTGTIKANFPTRISFRVASMIDSRTILNEMGAEQLLGNGDMLFLSEGGRVTRVHGAFVSDSEVEKIVSHIRKQENPDYIDEIVEEKDEENDLKSFENSSEDTLYNQAVSIVTNDKRVSISYIQKKASNRIQSCRKNCRRDGRKRYSFCTKLTGKEGASLRFIL